LGLFSFNHFVDLHTHHDSDADAIQGSVRRRRRARSF
jgi:hypothetical protein